MLAQRLFFMHRDEFLQNVPEEYGTYELHPICNVGVRPLVKTQFAGRKRVLVIISEIECDSVLSMTSFFLKNVESIKVLNSRYGKKEIRMLGELTYADVSWIMNVYGFLNTRISEIFFV